MDELLCRDPRATRRAAAAGREVPCYRCIMFRDSPTGCDLIDRGLDLVEQPEQPKPPEQTNLWSDGPHT